LKSLVENDLLELRDGTRKTSPAKTCVVAVQSADEEVDANEMKNDPVPNLTDPYLSTGMEIDQSEDIILTTT
jgi:hypothetical protein